MEADSREEGRPGDGELFNLARADRRAEAPLCRSSPTRKVLKPFALTAAFDFSTTSPQVSSPYASIPRSTDHQARGELRPLNTS